jgi:hypothetical protein
MDNNFPSDTASAHSSRKKIIPWSELLRRVCAIDVMVCPRCLGPMTVIAYLTDHIVLKKILSHFGLPTAPLPLSPARHQSQMNFYDDLAKVTEISTAHDPHRPTSPYRGPPTDDGADNKIDLDESFDWGA